MGKFIDLTGKKFGKWTVLRYVEKSKWLCKCECGVEKDVAGATLKHGTSSGCIKCRKIAKDFTGMVVGELTIIKRYFDKKEISWVAMCSCGNFSVVSSGNLTKRNTSRCQQCMRKNRRLGEIPRQYVGYETNMSQLTIDDNPHESEKIKGILAVSCKYCGRSFEPSYEQVRTRIKCINGRPGEGSFYCSKACKAACPTFRKIKYQENQAPGTSREVGVALRKEVLRRDGWSCQKCGATQCDTELHCHHVMPYSASQIYIADPDACITLCKSCHLDAHRKNGCRYTDLHKKECAK